MFWDFVRFFLGLSRVESGRGEDDRLFVLVGSRGVSGGLEGIGLEGE